MMRNLLRRSLLLILLSTCVASHRPAKRNMSTSFAGSNEYFLQALPEADQKEYVNTLAGWGVKVLRLWVTSTDAGCLKGSTDVTTIPPLESTVGAYNTTVLDALDNTLKILADNNIKAIISPHNANSLTGSATCDAYCEKYGNASVFYSSTDAKADYDKRLGVILAYESPNFGKPWKDLDSVILAFDLQNEPLIGQTDLLEENDPDDWLCGRAGTLSSLIASSSIKVATGGIGGSDYCCDHEYNLLEKALACDAIDIMSVHGYMSKASDWAYFITGDQSVLAQANAADKHVMIEEWGVSTSDTDGFDTQVDVFNDAGIPWLYWQVVPGLDGSQTGAPSSCGYDGYEIGINSTKGDIKTAVAAANAAPANQSWTGYVS